MNSCSCGNPVVGQGTLCARCNALRVFGLDAKAADKEIKAAYQVLVKVWHPDRFQGDPKMQQAAETKLKDVNSAYAVLCSRTADGGPSQRTRPAGSDAPPQQPPVNAEPAGRPAQASWTPPRPAAKRGSGRRIRPVFTFVFRLFLVAIVLLLCRYVWIAFNIKDPTGDTAEKVYQIGRENLLSGLDAPKRRFLEAVEHDWRRLDPRSPTVTPAPLTEEADNAPKATPQPTRTAPRRSDGRQVESSQIPVQRVLPYITVGSTREEVLEQQGTPTESSEDKLVYGRSELDFRNNRVVGWRIDPASTTIRVKLWPQSAVDTSLDFFTIGDSKDIVLVVQGTPTAFSADKFEYGASEVYFQDGEVVRWKNDPNSIQLRARQ
jgi:curved DNA-binding protein CbpA